MGEGTDSSDENADEGDRGDRMMGHCDGAKRFTK